MGLTDWLRVLAQDSQKAWVWTPAWPLPGYLTSHLLMFSCKMDRIRVNTFWGYCGTHWAHLLRVLSILARQRICFQYMQAASLHSYICFSPLLLSLWSPFLRSLVGSEKLSKTGLGPVKYIATQVTKLKLDSRSPVIGLEFCISCRYLSVWWKVHRECWKACLKV